MIATLFDLHATLLGLAAIAALVTGGLLLARNPVSAPARLHALYAAALAWWFVCMAMSASAANSDAAASWSRMLQLSLGMLPGILYHLNTSLAGLAELYRTRIRVHWVLSLALTSFALVWPALLDAPTEYRWGYYPRYTGWGLLVVGAIVFAFLESEVGHRIALRREDPRSARSQKVGWFYRGNLLSALALVDFLPAFGFGVYPFGYAVITFMHTATLYGSLRHRLTEVTPEFAAEHVLREMPDGVLVIDGHGWVQVANQAAADILWCDLGDLTGRPVDGSGRNPAVIDLLTGDRHGGQTSEISFVDLAGKQRHIRASIATITDQAAFPIANLWALRDITGERMARDARDRLEAIAGSRQKLEGLGVMARGIAHDFNNMLLTISGNAELAGRLAVDAPAVRSHLERIEAAAHRGSDLTGQMLTYAGGVPIERRPVDLNQVITEVAGLMGVAVSKKASLRLDLNPSLPPVVGDPVQLSQVILNLITNASEALEGSAGSIILRTGVTVPDKTFRRWDGSPEVGGPEESDYVFLEAEDTGRGMDRDTLDKIFDPFFTTKFNGRGLGLATVVGIVRAHAGLTRVTSEPTRGTTVTIALPIAPAAEPHSAGPSIDTPGWQGRGLALIADDEPEVRRVMSTMLTQSGFEVIEAANGKEAVAAFERRADEVAVVVMDRTMPELDGEEAAARIRTISSTVPIVFITGYSDTALTVDSRSRVLHKPFKAATLTNEIREAMDVD